MLVDGGRRLGSAVADDVVEIEGGDAVFAESASEGGAAIHRFGGVISHVVILVLSDVGALGQ